MEMLSLYDYLKKPAGGELGKKVAEAAMNEKILIGSKQVSNPKRSRLVINANINADRHLRIRLHYLSAFGWCAC